MRTLARTLGLLVLSVAMIVARTNAAPGGAEAFEKLKSLAGHWETDKTNMNKASLDLELTAGGTAVLEKSHMTDNGKPVEMTTLYYLDGDQVKLTHYCMAGNQPTMRGTYLPEAKTIVFDFVGATNLKAPTTDTCITPRTHSSTTIISRRPGPFAKIRRMPSRKTSPTSA